MKLLLRRYELQIRFLAAGSINTILSAILLFSFQYLLVELLSPQGILLLAFLATSPFGYLNMKFMVFKTKGNHLREYLKYLASLLFVCALGMLMLSFFLHVLHVNVYAAQGLNLVTSAVIAYLLLSLFAFARSRTSKQEN